MAPILTRYLESQYSRCIRPAADRITVTPARFVASSMNFMGFDTLIDDAVRLTTLSRCKFQVTLSEDTKLSGIHCHLNLSTSSIILRLSALIETRYLKLRGDRSATTYSLNKRSLSELTDIIRCDLNVDGTLHANMRRWMICTGSHEATTPDRRQRAER